LNCNQEKILASFLNDPREVENSHGIENNLSLLREEVEEKAQGEAKDAEEEA
jgi:hypothetical protein